VKVAATYNIKGGVGKTSTAVNLAYLSAREGRRTLLWDLDPQGAATYLFRVRPRVKGGGRGLVTRKRPMEAALKATDFEGLDLLPADFSYRNMDLDLDDTKKRTRRLRQLLQGLADDYDTVFDVGSAVYARYMGDMNHASRQGVEHEARKRVAVFVTPEKTASWDHRKL